MAQRLFIELANLHQVTPQWLEQKQGFGFGRVPFEPNVRSIQLAQREIRAVLHQLVANKSLGNTSLRKLRALADPERVSELHELKHSDVVSPVAIEAAKDFLEFALNESRQHIGLCPWCLRFFIGRSNKKYCNPQHGVRYNNARKVASGYSKKKMREYRDKDPVKYM